jgi:hypothetical protein
MASSTDGRKHVLFGGVENRFYEQSVDDVMPAVDGDELILPDSGDIDDTMSNESHDVLNVDPCLMDSEDELVIDGSVICQYDSDIDDEPSSTIDDGDILTINHDKIIEYDVDEVILPVASTMTKSATAVDMSNAGTYHTDVFVYQPVDHATYKRLACQLGGLHIDVVTYQTRFGAINKQSPFGDRVWEGMKDMVATYPFMHKVWGTRPWFCYFVSPELFSKDNAANPMSDINRGLSFCAENAYPAIVFLNDHQHSYLESITKSHRLGKSPSDDDFFDGVQLDGRKTKDISTIHPSISTIVRYDPMFLMTVDMLCLKILIAGCRPWRVHSSWLQLYRPVPQWSFGQLMGL